MLDDRVRIDPEFLPPRRSGGPSRWVRLAGLGAVVAVALILGWLLRSPAPDEPDPTEAASTSTTAPTSTTSPTVEETTSTVPVEGIGLALPLEEAVPGFADAITMVVEGDADTRVLQWWPSRSTPETMVSLSHDESPLEFVGLDASGFWYTLRDDESGVLSVHPVSGPIEIWPPSVWREVVGLRVAASAWHDSKRGRLAWLTCSRARGGPVTLYTLDLTDAAAEAIPLPLVGRACGEILWSHSGAWGDWGFAWTWWDEESEDWGETAVLLDADGAEIAALDNALDIDPGPGGVIWTEAAELRDRSYLVTSDGETHHPVPGLDVAEWVDDASWSPDRSHLAISVRTSLEEPPMIRIVEIATDSIVDEIADPGAWPMAWSSDGRFLFYERQGDDPDRWPPWDWMVYDTTTGVATGLPLPEGQFVREIRSQPLRIADQFTPVDWGIEVDQAGPGVHLVHTIVDVRPLLSGQVEDVWGELVWADTVVDLCNIEIREMGDGFVHVGDIFGTQEGCGANPTAMQDAFDELGMPETACLTVRAGDRDHEYCAPLS